MVAFTMSFFHQDVHTRPKGLLSLLTSLRHAPRLVADWQRAADSCMSSCTDMCVLLQAEGHRCVEVHHAAVCVCVQQRKSMIVCVVCSV